MAVTIKSVADKAHVSIATVSRVINHKGYVSERSRKNVIKAIRKTGYKIKRKNIKKISSNLIDVILPTLTNPFYAEFFEKLTEVLNENGYKSCLIINKSSNMELGHFIDEIIQKKILGLVTSSPLKVNKNEDISRLPIVTFDRYIGNATNVKSNNLDGGYRIAEQVLSKGKKNVLILAGSKNDFYPLNNRIKGMLTVFNRYKIHIDMNYLNLSSSLIAKKIAIAQIIGSKKYDAICCTDDITALLVNEFMLNTGQHPLITGFDGTELVRDLFPHLVTIVQPLNDITNLIVEILNKKIHHPSHRLEKEFICPVTLVD